MGLFDRWRVARAVATFEAPPARRGLTFDSSGNETVTSEFFSFFTTAEDYITPAARVSRPEAIQCAAVKRVRDLICATIGGLPLNYLDADNRPSRSPLLEQPERGVPRSVTMTRLVEDMLFEGYGWWRVVDRDYRGYPTRVVRLDPRTVTFDDQQRVWVRRDGRSQGSSQEHVEDRDVIRFWSPNDPLLTAGARAIRTLLRLDRAAGNYADTPVPNVVLTPTEGADPAEDTDVEELIDAYDEARRSGSTAYIPAALKLQQMQMSAVDIQLADQRQNAVLDIARIGGVDPEDLSVSTTSRTYQNGDSRQRTLVDMTLNAYIQAVQDRLSMADVTPRGYAVRFDLNGFLRSNEDQRVETYAKAVALGLYPVETAQQREELPLYEKPASAAPAIAAPVRPLRSVPSQEVRPVAATADGTTHDFSADDVLVLGFEGGTGDTFEVDVKARTIAGRIAPWNRPGRTRGRNYTFLPGSARMPTDLGRVKLLGGGHDNSLAVARAVEFENRPDGAWARFKVARGPNGDQALTMAADGVWDGLSIGLRDDARFENRRDVMTLIDGEIAHVALTGDPAFTDARVASVVFDRAPDTKGNTMPDTGTDTVAPDTGTPAAPAIDYAALAAALAPHLAQTFAAQPAPAVEPVIQDGPEVIPAAGGGTAGGDVVFVNEGQGYNFDKQRGPGREFRTGTRDLSADLVAMGNGDHAAYQRVLDFTAEQLGALTFADIDTTDGAALNPSQQRPDLYVDLRAYQYPLWNAVVKEGLTDRTPKVLPKYSSSSGLVAAHTQAVEPAVGAAAWTTQTITPGALSGKVEITRELWDQGGTPAVSNQIWNLMVKGWFEALEAKVVTALDAETPTGITLTAGAEDADLSLNIAGEWAALQFIRGGFVFDSFATQIDLYKKLAQAQSDSGEFLFPIINPSNRIGSATKKFGQIDVAGVTAYPAWALAATGSVAASSYLFEAASVYAAASAPQRLEWNFGATVQTANIPQIAHVTLGIWGYAVAAVTDVTGLREVIYDPVA